MLLVPSEPIHVDRAPIAAAMRRGRITADVVTPLTAIVDELRRMDDQAGGGRVLPLVQPQIDTVTAMLDRGSYTSGVGVQLHQALADVTQLAGWAAHDAGRRRTPQDTDEEPARPVGGRRGESLAKSSPLIFMAARTS